MRTDGAEFTKADVPHWIKDAKHTTWMWIALAGVAVVLVLPW